MSTVAFVWTSQLSDGISEFVRRVGKDQSVVVRELMRVYLETLYHWTAPPTKGNMGSRGGRKGGKAMVAGDIAAVMHPITPDYYDMLDRAFGPDIVAKEYGKKDGTIYLIDRATLIGSDKSSLESWHHGNRQAGGRTGRVGMNANNNQTGRWKPANKGYVRGNGPFKRYSEGVQKRVGKLKSGWAYPLDLVGSKLPDSWASTAGEESGASGIAPSGGYREEFPESTFGGTIEAENNVSYFRDDGFMERGRRYIEDWMTKEKYIDGWLDKLFKRHGVAR